MKSQILKSQLKSFWKDELIANETYSFISKRVKTEKKEIFQQISKMEKGHSEIWNKISSDEGFKEFKVTFGLRLHIFILKLISIFIPLPIMVNYLEYQEKRAIFNYSVLLEHYQNKAKTYNLIERVIKDEILHETHMIETILDKMSYLNRTRQAIHGFTLAIMKIFALLIGFLVVFPDEPEVVLITGIITVISGSFVTFASTFISSRGHKEIKDNHEEQITIKEEVHPEALQADLSNALLEKGIQKETIEDILSIIGNDFSVLSNLVRSIRLDSGGVSPITSAFVTGIYFLIGGIPVILPFIFPVFFLSFTILYAAIVSAIIALIFTFITGLIIGILSGKQIFIKAFEKVLIITIASGLMYLIGYLISIIPGV
jgi:VIT1/CCC1 family predicted Fe2+/Mn2+ transporter